MSKKVNFIQKALEAVFGIKGSEIASGYVKLHIKELSKDEVIALGELSTQVNDLIIKRSGLGLTIIISTK